MTARVIVKRPLAHRISHLRNMRGWKQEDLAERAGVNVATISRIERGETQSPNPRTLAAILAALEWE